MAVQCIFTGKSTTTTTTSTTTTTNTISTTTTTEKVKGHNGQYTDYQSHVCRAKPDTPQKYLPAIKDLSSLFYSELGHEASHRSEMLLCSIKAPL